MQGFNISERSLRLLANFVSSWPGRKIGPRGLVAIANEAGSKLPLVWVFNSAHEFPALAEALGPDQPLIGLRSLNMVVRINRLVTWDERVLANIYVEELDPWLGGRSFFIGGNCQGAPIAAAMARDLLLAGRDVRGFVAMEWVDLAPLPLVSTLLFGAESELHNPFLRDVDPLPLWSRIYRQHHIGILPGNHGTYFSRETVPALAGHLQEALGRTSEPPAEPRSGVPPMGLPESVSANAALEVDLAAPDGMSGDDVVFLWDSHFPCLPHREVARSASERPDRATVLVTAPPEPGPWTLQTFRCRPGEGPIAWNGDTQTFHRVEVVGARQEA